MPATNCPMNHKDCTPISDVVLDDMPDKCTQQYYCPECEASYEVTYHHKYTQFLEEPKHER